MKKMSVMTRRFVIIFTVLLTGSVSEHNRAVSALSFIIAVKDAECVYHYAPSWGYRFSGSFSARAVNPKLHSFRVPYPPPGIDFTVLAFGTDDLIYSLKETMAPKDHYEFEFESPKIGFHKFCFQRHDPSIFDDHAEVVFKLDMVLNRPGLLKDAAKLNSDDIETCLSLLASM